MIYLCNSIMSHIIYYSTRYLVQLESTSLENLLNILLESLENISLGSFEK